ncbi:hypothetical protein SELMODRAFT_101351, partial [Selaginella moellendorffii]
QRRERVRAAMLHAWTSYEKFAWGEDELQPLTKNGVNSFGGLGATIIDAMDTLYIMGLHTQFQKARTFVAGLNFNINYEVNLFETTVRILGGLISTYDLTKDDIFLTKARQLADRLLPAFNTETGIPYGRVNLASGEARNLVGASVLAELGTLQVEFIALSQRTGLQKYRIKVETAMRTIQKIFPKDGLLPVYIDPHTLQRYDKVTFGGTGDSFYEYLLKTWVLGGKTQAVQGYRQMWERSMDGLMTLIKKKAPYYYVFERNSNGDLFPKMEELACFVPAMLVLGSYDASAQKKNQYLWLAQQLTTTCYNFFYSSPIRIAADTYIYNGKEMTIQDPKNIMRPETLESIFYMWQLTNNKAYREWGWNIFLAYEKYSRVENGYVGHVDVTTGKKDNKMQSYFLAETLKYLFLLYSSSDNFPFNQWVFNTEAHPIKIIPR